MHFSSSFLCYAIAGLAHVGHVLGAPEMRTQAPVPLRLMTQNIRYGIADPLDDGEKPWAQRLPKQLAEYKFYLARQPAPLLFLQEAIRFQLDDIVNGLNTGSAPRWKWIGRGRDNDSVADNEYNPILYQPDVWELKGNWTRWLSLTPTVPYSKYPNASLPRIVNVGKFRHKASNRDVLMLCTHLDASTNVDIRAGQVKVVAATAAEFAKQGAGKPDLPVIVAGDFNSNDTEPAYHYMTGQAGFVDAWRNIPKDGYQYGDDITYTGFKDQSEAERIDFVFPRKPNGTTPPWEIEGVGVPPDVFDDGVFLSDHRPVVADLNLRG